jgi:adenine deaminase
VEDAVARVRQGMKAMLRQGSGWLDVATQIRAVTELGLDPRNFILCTDDSHSETLVCEGHVNRAVREAISHGLAPMTAIQMATINAAEHFGLTREVGQLAPGRYADVLLLRDLPSFKPEVVIARGQVVAEGGQVRVERPGFKHPEWARNAVHLKRPLEAADFRLGAPAPSGEVTAHVIGVVEKQAPTQHRCLRMTVQGGEVRPDLQRDIAKLAVVERHQGSGRVTVGLVQGFGLDQPCAIATTVAHDCHQMIIVGTDEGEMAAAANALAKLGGGQVVVRGGQVIGQVALPIAGLMSDAPAEQVAQQAETVLAGFKACGCRISNPNMQLSLSALVVIPELRLSDLGLVDATQFKFIPVLEP